MDFGRGGGALRRRGRRFAITSLSERLRNRYRFQTPETLMAKD
jgi:hypothetical protein